ncbi:hypothetical protein JQC92_15925 [Shewanella sp. 202IG2-18]|uniref:hypothetical protein n=1 Tax=Parashewanella hymeniacidonis TaxID=2807618 RepID=UPI0019611A5F|nr:hypothetical protein [Parashewanella hymeniacidonis]MBM7073503.1 hypothetical protein [Parashewanella hymeniacidonis]
MDNKQAARIIEMCKEKYIELYDLLAHVDSENDGLAEYSDLQADRVLSDEELILHSYIDLMHWVHNEPDSDSKKYQQLLLNQFENAFSWVVNRQPQEQINFGWLIQEYICAVTQDYSFGVSPQK